MSDLDVRELYRRYGKRPPPTLRRTPAELAEGFAELVSLGEIENAARVADAAFAARDALYPESVPA